MLNDELVELFNNSGHHKDVESIKDFITFHNQRFIPKIKKGSRPTAELLEALLIYLQCSLYRSRTYLDGYIDALNKRSILMAGLAARAHLEVSSSLGYLLKKIHIANFDFKNIVDDLNKLMLGSREKSLLFEGTPNYDSINVMTMIDASDYMFNKLAELTTPQARVRNTYNELSEFCHPNGLGLVFAVDISDESEEINFMSPSNSLKLEFLVPFHARFIFSTELFKGFYSELIKLLKIKNDTII
jgi:hypothetical protein